MDVLDCKIIKDILTNYYEYDVLYRFCIRINYLIHEYQCGNISRDDFIYFTDKYMNRCRESAIYDDEEIVLKKVDELEKTVKSFLEIF